MFRLNLWRRLFHHSALGLASACLLYAEAFFLPGPLLVGLYLLAGVQVLAFAAEGRQWVLPGWAANLLAGAVAGGGVAWIASELNRPDSLLASLPLPAGLLPYIGPMLIGLLVVKLFRPPTPRDFWLLQGVGALQVALACVLATNPESGFLFGVLLAAYLACVLGRLALHYFEEEERFGSSPTALDAKHRAADRLPFAYLMSPFCLRWVLAVVAFAAPLFLLTPRIQGPSWDSSVMAASGQHGGTLGNRAGFSLHIDLNHDGPVRLTDEEIFRVTVEAQPGQPLPVLPADQYWRGGVLDLYERGQWSNQEIKWLAYGDGNSSPPPQLGPGRYRLDFTIGPSAGGFVLAQPVLTGLGPDHSTAVESIGGANPIPLIVSARGPVLPRLYNGRHDYHYQQTINEADDANRIPTYDSILYTGGLKSQPVPNLAEWTSALLKRLAVQPVYKLAPSDALIDVKHPWEKPSWQERVGRALTAYLARSGAYGYTLDLRRQDPSIDPVMDFLVNTRQGHCERFASALALMLRSQGIPSRLVVGFRGAGNPMNGVYVIRQRQAHAWVEMLTPGRPAQWITLDPTPATEPTEPIPYSLWEWWQDQQRTGQQLWGGLVVNYTADEQTDLWTRLRSPLAKTTGKTIALSLGLLIAVGTLTWTGLRWRRRTRRRGDRGAAHAAAGYDRMLTLLARHAGLRPRIGQTPREFAKEARCFLAAIAAAQPFVDLPDEIVDQLYRVRFGGQSLTEDENTRITGRLDQLAAALKKDRVERTPVVKGAGGKM